MTCEFMAILWDQRLSKGLSFVDKNCQMHMFLKVEKLFCILFQTPVIYSWQSINYESALL